MGLLRVTNALQARTDDFEVMRLCLVAGFGGIMPCGGKMS